MAFISMISIQILNPDIELSGLTNLWGTILILIILRSISIFALILEKCDRLPTTVIKKSRLQIYAYKDFFVYPCTFLLFSLASSLAWILIPEDFQTQVEVGNTMRFILIAVFGVIAGLMADRYGRKQPIIIGLATLGIGFLLLAFNMSEPSVFIYMALSGITWGSFFVIFLAVPGDLSLPGLREKFYSLGYILPLFGSLILSAIPVTDIEGILPSNLIALTLGICLFLAIYPLSRAKETLTESKKQERRMSEHLEKVRKIVEETEKEEND
jgi:MFS family permease